LKYDPAPENEELDESPSKYIAYWDWLMNTEEAQRYTIVKSEFKI